VQNRRLIVRIPVLNFIPGADAVRPGSKRAFRAVFDFGKKVITSCYR